MKKYIFIEINGSAIITVTATSKKEAKKLLGEIVKTPSNFELE